MPVKPIPEGFHTITPHLIVRDAAGAIEFYKQAFGAESRMIHYMPDGKISHADLRIGDSILMLNDEFPQWGSLSPQSIGGTSVVIHLYVEDVDSVYQRAVSAGAQSAMPIMDAFWGDRYGQITDPYGHRWSIATHKEDLSDEEIDKRGKEFMAQMAKQSPH